MAESKSRKKRRRANFTDKEILTLIEEVKKRKHVIMGKLDKTVTAQAKVIAWEEITKCVNLVSEIHCNPDELRIKFKDLKFMVKKKAAQEVRDMNQIGGRVPAVPTKFTELEEAMLYFLPSTSFTSLPMPESEDNIISLSIPATADLDSPAAANLCTPAAAAGLGTPAAADLVTPATAGLGTPATSTYQPLPSPSAATSDNITFVTNGIEYVIPVPQYSAEIAKSTSQAAARGVRSTCQPILTTQPATAEARHIPLVSPSPPSASAPTNTSNRPVTPADYGGDCRLVPEVLQTQKETPDYVSNVVAQQMEAVEVQRQSLDLQRQTLLVQQEIAAARREGVQVQREALEVQRSLGEALRETLLALKEVISAHK